MRAEVGELAQRLSTTEPALEEIARRLDFLVVERADDPRVEQVSEAMAELQERVTSLSQRVETAAERSSDAAVDAGAALEKLRDELAALGARVTDLSASDDVDQLRALVEALSERPLRDPDLAAQIEDLQAVVESLTERSGKDPDLVAQIEDLQAVVQRLDERPGRDQELIAQVDTLALRMAELGDRVDVLGAGVQSFSGDADALHELQGALAELTQRPLADPAIERRVDELVALVDELARRPASDPAVERRVDALVEVVDELVQRPAVDEVAQQRMEEIAAAFDGLRASVDALAEKPAGDPALDEKLWEITSRLEAVERAEGFDVLRAQIAELAELASRPAVDPALVQRLTELEHRLDAVPGDDVLERLDSDGRSLGFRIDGVVARLDEMATTIEEAGTSQVSREAWDEARSLITSRLEVEAEMSTRLEQLEERLAELASYENGAAPAGQTAPDPELEQRFTALASRMDQLANQVAASGRRAAPSGEAGEGASEDDEGVAVAGGANHQTLERDVEHVLMAIERLSVHLGAHERALTELMGAGGIVAQVRELSARVGDLETYGGGGGGEAVTAAVRRCAPSSAGSCAGSRKPRRPRRATASASSTSSRRPPARSTGACSGSRPRVRTSRAPSRPGRRCLW